MKRSNRILILVGILLAVVAFVGVIALSNKGGGGGGGSSATPTPTLEATTPVVIAAKDIALGQTITNDMVTVQQVTVSQAAAYGSDIFSSVDQVRDKIAATDIKKGDPLHDGIDFLHVRPGSITAGQS
ncbi:MAG TPA: SAF domain-containing protein, partial [Candidatus Limnocylindrales bacterium]